MNVLVTGGAKGIGKAISTLFASHGYNVIINYNTSSRQAFELAEKLNAFAIKADVSNFNEVEKMFDEIRTKCGRVDVLINNAGIALKQGLTVDVSEREFDSVMDVNVKGTFNCTKLALNDMMLKNKGAIVNISSVWGDKGGSCEAVYSASKGAVNSFTKALAKELKYSGITVNAVAPDFTDTDMNGHLSEEEKQAYLKHTKKKRALTPEEVAVAVYETVVSGKTGKIIKL